MYRIHIYIYNIVIGLEFHQIKRKWLFVGTYKPPVVNPLLSNVVKWPDTL